MESQRTTHWQTRARPAVIAKESNSHLAKNGSAPTVSPADCREMRKNSSRPSPAGMTSPRPRPVGRQKKTVGMLGMSLARMGTELRCQCIKTESRIIHPKHIQTVELIQSGAHCPNLEVIATLKSGQVVCLDPSAKWVEKIIKRILQSSSKEGS
ncbi:interleukin-8-like isoform X1 [Pleurodeles waltl]|uniref:interleukin-8-like isoform X1 n=1 Tax=Pleurodeles waltl TaxID=8319 RepID=UPI00370978EA